MYLRGARAGAAPAELIRVDIESDGGRVGVEAAVEALLHAIGGVELRGRGKECWVAALR